MFFAAVPLMPIYSRGWYRLRTKVQAHRERARVGTVSWLVLTSLVSHGKTAVSSLDPLPEAVNAWLKDWGKIDSSFWTSNVLRYLY